MEQASHLGQLIKRINDRLKKGADRNLRHSGLTLSQLRTLIILFERGEALTSQRELETALGVSHPTVTGLLKRLEAKELVTFSAGDTDRRVKNVFLTEKSRRMFDCMSEHKRVLEAQLLKGFSDEERDTLISLLLRVYNNLEEAAQENPRGGKAIT